MTWKRAGESTATQSMCQVTSRSASSDLTHAGVSEPGEIVALRLRLELAREERKARERDREIEMEHIELQGRMQRQNQQVGGMSNLKEIKAMLHTFCDSDGLAFLLA